MTEKKATTAERLCMIIEQRNIKQSDILERCLPYLEQYKVKMNRSDISQYVSGKATPKQNKLYILARALNVSEAWLMGFDVSPERQPGQEPKSELLKALERLENEMDERQLERLLEYARMLKAYKGGPDNAKNKI